MILQENMHSMHSFHEGKWHFLNVHEYLNVYLNIKYNDIIVFIIRDVIKCFPEALPLACSSSM
jgi:hypothetical protein